MTVGRLLEEIGSAELAEWLAFYDREPWGCAVDDLRAGTNPAVTINMNRDRDSDPVGPMEFFPWNKPAEPDPEEERAKVERAIRKRLLGDANGL
jgi:hypothetical protein